MGLTPSNFMRVLSINFGHDASLCLFQDGELIDFLEVERESRLKHHLGISGERITRYLAANGLAWNQIDLVCASGTQYWGTYSSEDLAIHYGYAPDHSRFVQDSPLWEMKNYKLAITESAPSYRDQVGQQELQQREAPVRRQWFLPNLANFVSGHPDGIRQLLTLYRGLDADRSRQIQANYFCPLVMTLNSHRVPGVFVDHHAAHANYAAFYAKENSLIATHDGGLTGSPFNSGGIYLNHLGGPVYPLLSHELSLGHIYDVVAGAMGLDAGKLMGLSSYARPNRHIHPVAVQYLESVRAGKPLPTSFIAGLIFETAKIDPQIRQQHTKKFAFNITSGSLDLAIQAAANAQALVQHVYVSLVSDIAEKIHDVDESVRVAYMTGGFSLNCPTNSLINQVSASIQYKPLPAVGDTGLSIGAAVALFKYLGVSASAGAHADAMAAAFPPSYRSRVPEQMPTTQVRKLDDLTPESVQRLVDELVAGKVLCIHQGRSEVGPRALGHRSILAWAGSEAVRDRINAAKGREAWRPLAPIVLREDFSRFFSGDPDDCRFMLTVSKVKERTIPAVTHVDNTARVQVLDEKELFLTGLLKRLRAKGVAPVIVNTSFNCAGEPLVESLEDAVRSFRKMNFDYLVTETGIYVPC